MKKYLLFIISMLCVSIGAWADSGTFGTYNSTWSTNGTVLTLHVNMPNDLASQGTPATGSWDLSAYTRVVLETELGITLTGGNPSPLAQFSALYRNIPVADLRAITVTLNETYGGSGVYTLAMADANLNTFKNVIVPAAYSSNPGDLVLSNMYNAGQTATTNNYSISGTTVNAVLRTGTDGLTALSNISSDATTLKILNEVEAIDLRSVLVSGKILDLSSITTASDGSNDITVAAGVKVVCLSGGVKDRVKGTDLSNVTVANPVISCAATEVTAKINELKTAGIAPTSITITSGDVDATILEALNVEGLTYLNLQEATVTPAINTIELPSTLEALVLPKSATPEATCEDATLLDKIKANSSLKYVYAPYNGAHDNTQVVADYVWVCKPGGLNEALTNEAWLKSAVYVKIASDVSNGVALNEDDANFESHSINGPSSDSDTNYPWQYIDMSETIVTASATLAETKPHEGGYRIILPNGLTGDNMAIFASNGNKGKVAAVYSYNGTTLNMMELTDATYHTNALADSRIVKSGTTAVKIVAGSYGGTTYSKFGPNLLAALNGAAPTITSATIAVGNGFYTAEDAKVSNATTFTFANPQLTSLTMNFVENSNVTIEIGTACTALTHLYLNETTLAGVTAAGVSNLTYLTIGHATISGDVNLSGTGLTSLTVAQDNIGGTLNVSNTPATSYDFSQLTATKVDASNTNILTTLNINGISLNNDSFTANDDTSKDGKVEVTRDGGDYSGLTITTAQGFNTSRIIPSTGIDDGKGYELQSIAEARVEISAEGSSLSATVPAAVTAYNEAQNPVESNTVGNVKVLHVTGTLTDADIEYIKSNLTALELLDLSQCTYASGLETLASKIVSTSIPTNTAIILPGTPNTEASTIASVKALQDANYECVGYYTAYETDETLGRMNSKFNVYAYNGTVRKLTSNEPAIIDSNTNVTFLRRYNSTDVDATTHNYPEVTPFLLSGLSSVVETSGCASVDMTWLNISNLGVDFSDLNTYHVIIPQNSTAATTTRNGIVYNNDITKVDDGTNNVSTETNKYYKFHANTTAVSTYKAPAAPYATGAYFDGKSITFDNGYGGLNKTATLVYAIKPGGLSSITDYLSDKQKEADVVMVAGALDNRSLEWGLNTLTNKQIDLSRATLVTTGEDPFNWSDYNNSIVEYLALPDGQNDVINAKSADDYFFKSYTDDEDKVHGLSALKAVGAYDPTTSTYTVHSTERTVTSTSPLTQENSVYVISSMCRPSTSREAGKANGTQHVVMSGYLTLSDIQNKGSDPQAGLNTNSTGAVVTADFSNAVFLNNEHMTFTGATWNANILTSMILPTDERQKRIPANSMNNFAALNEICIPYNYEEIGTAAFYLADLRTVTTTDANGAEINNGDNTFTFSKNLKSIGDAPSSPTTTSEGKTYPTPIDYPVFFNNNLKYLTDVYILRTGYEDGDFAPTKCYRNAFGAGPTYGWGGFNGGSIYCREKYMNGEQLYTILHFPDLASVGNDQTKYDNVKKTYTDPTKEYTKKDQTGAVDANGESPLWPTHSELGRSYNQAIRGLIWKDWNIDEGKQAIGNINGGTITTPPGNPIDVTLTKDSNPEHYDFTDYVGWHEFVLSIATYVAPDEKVEDNKVIRTYEEDDWYTFCIPFDMTEQEVALLLGVPRSTDEDPGTDIKIVNKLKTSDSKGNSDGRVTKNIMPTIVTLKQVTRSSSTNTVSLRCSEDMGSDQKFKFKYYNPTTGNYTSNGYVDLDGDSEEDADEKIMIRAGYPYIIRPYTLCDPETGVKNAVPSNNLGKQILTRYAFKMIASAINHSDTREAIGGDITLVKSNFAKPYEGHKVQAYSDDPGSVGPLYRDAPTDDKPYNYTFVGQYWTQYLPQNCFYMSGHKWYHNTYPREEGYYWYPYTCLILTSNEDGSGLFRYDTDNTKYGETNYDYTIIPEETGKDKDGHAVFDKQMQIRFKDGFDDSFTSNARVYHFVFDEDIMDFDEDGQATGIEVLDGQYVAPVRGKVYNMAGQYVGNSIEGLSKGMYIVNGKKIVIR